MTGKTCISKINLTSVRTLICLLVLAIALTGCEPLRKKFTRKKKKSKNESAEFIPVLDPIDYPPSMETVDGKYRHRYQLWKVWQKDLRTALEERNSARRLLYINSQLLVQLEEMQKLIDEEKQKEMAKFIAEYRGVGDDVNVPEVMRNDARVSRRVDRIEKRFKKVFGIDQIKEHLR